MTAPTFDYHQVHITLASQPPELTSAERRALDLVGKAWEREIEARMVASIFGGLPSEPPAPNVALPRPYLCPIWNNRVT